MIFKHILLLMVVSVLAIPLTDDYTPDLNAEAGEEDTEDASLIDAPLRALDRVTHFFSKHKHHHDDYGCHAPNYMPPPAMYYPIQPIQPVCDIPAPYVNPATITKYKTKVHTHTDTYTNLDVSTRFKVWTQTFTDTQLSTATRLCYPEHTHTLTRSEEYLVYPGFTAPVPTPEAICAPVACAPCFAPVGGCCEKHHGDCGCDFCPLSWLD